MLVFVEKSKELVKLLGRIKQRKAVLSLLIEESWAADIRLKVVMVHSIYLLDKLTVRLHHNNCMVLYLKENQEEHLKDYRQGQRTQLWQRSLDQIVREDLSRRELPTSLRRVHFDTNSFESVKEISQLVRENYKEMVRAKRHVELELERNEELNNNVIEELDCSRRAMHLP